MQIKTCHMLQYAAWKWLKICTRAVGADHRIIVSVTVNQGISFYLGCPKISSCFNYNCVAFGKKKKEKKKRQNMQGILTTIQKTSFLEATRDFRMEGNTETKSWKRINYHSHLQKKEKKKHPQKRTPSLWETVLMMFAWVSELGSH